MRDVAWLNLYAARGLPGGEWIDVEACLRTLDEWAARVKRETERLAHLYDRAPQEWEHSRNRFRVAALVTVLQRDLHVHYRQALVEMADEEFFKRADHLFVHGVTQGKGGTCSSLPVVFAAVGRRLGYPIKLAHAYRHLFARWDDPGGERFNIECTARGFVSKPDECYADLGKDKDSRPRTEDFEHLQSLTPRQEMAGFFTMRGICARTNKWWREAVRAFAHARELNATNQMHVACFDDALEGWEQHLKGQLRPGFPAMRIGFPPRCFPSIPLEAERKIIHLEALERVLTDPSANERWWEPLRSNPTALRTKVPEFIEVEFPAGPGGYVEVRYLNATPAYSDPGKRVAW